MLFFYSWFIAVVFPKISIDNMTIKKFHILGVGLVASLAVPLALLSATAKANTVPQQLAQAESAEPVESCVALQEVTTGETEIRKRIENRRIARVGGVNGNFYTISVVGCQ